MTAHEEWLNPFSLKNRNIIVTGASSGIGRATSVLLSHLDARLAIVARDRKRLYETVELLKGGGHDVFFFDLANLEDIGNLVDEIRSSLGPIAGLIHCAGLSRTMPLRKSDMEDLRMLMRINLEAFIELSKGITKKRNCASDGASIVGISSMAAITGVSSLSAYSASKGALLSAVRSLAVEFAPRRIRFNCVCPGWIRTPMLDEIRWLYPDEESFKKALADKHPLGPGSPEDVANAAAFLLSDASCWTTGIALVVDGGYSA